jgi:hypothetical protein
VLEDAVEEAEDVAHALGREAVFEERSPERLHVGGADVRDLAVAEMRRDVDALHVLASLAIGLARAA